MRRYELQRMQVETSMSVEVEAKCDRCHVDEVDAAGGELYPVVIEFNLAESEGDYTSLDYCRPCVAELAPLFVAVGSRAPMLTDKVTTLDNGQEASP